MKRSRTQLALAMTAIGAWSSMLHAAQIRNDITGLMDDSDSNCPAPVPVFDQDDCSYNASDPTGFGVAEWIGPLFNAGYYVPGEGPPPAIAEANDPKPGDGKTPPPVTGTIDIDDQDTVAGADDTITATIVIGTSERNFGAGARGTGVETWSSLTMKFGPVVVSSAVANASGGFDYVIGDHGMPPFLVDAATGTDFWPSETGPDADSAVGRPEDQYWAGPSPVGIAPIEDNVRGVASIGTTATLATTGYSCYDGPPNNGDGIGGAASPCDAKGRLGGAGDFENVILSLSTDSGGNITAATLIWVQQQDVVVTPAGQDSWVAGVIEFTGVCPSCDAAGTAQDDVYSVDQDSAGNVLDVGANDTEFNLPTTATISALPNQGGTAIIQGSPGDPDSITVNYTPAPGFRGTETFQYTMADSGGSDSATVTVIVLTTDANDDVAATHLNTPVSIFAGTNDVGFASPATLAISVPPDHGGTASVQNSPGSPAGIVVNFTPVAAVGTPTYSETFQYSITDGVVTGNATVTVTVNNQIPAAPDQAVTTGEGSPAVINIAGLPGAQLGDAPVSIAITAQPANGTTTVAGTSVTYTPSGFFIGTDDFAYTVTDADGETSSGAISVTVGPPLVPDAVDDIANVIEGESVDIDVTANDTAGSGTMADQTVTITRQPHTGSVSVGADNGVTYGSAAGAHGNDNFEYTLTDTNGDVSAPATVQVGIGLDREPQPAGGVSAFGPWDLAGLAALLAHRSRRRKLRHSRSAQAPDQGGVGRGLCQ